MTVMGTLGGLLVIAILVGCGVLLHNALTAPVFDEELGQRPRGPYRTAAKGGAAPPDERVSLPDDPPLPWPPMRKVPPTPVRHATGEAAHDASDVALPPEPPGGPTKRPAPPPSTPALADAAAEQAVAAALVALAQQGLLSDEQLRVALTRVPGSVARIGRSE